MSNRMLYKLASPVASVLADFGRFEPVVAC